MLRRTTLHGFATAAIAAMALALTACGSEGDSGGTGDSGGDPSGAPASSSAPSSSASAGAGESAANADAGSVSGLQAKLDEVLSAAPITFAAESPELTEESRSTLKSVAEAAAEVPDAKLEVRATAGYQDAEQAKALSQQRADAVSKELTSGGVAEDRVEAVAAGNEGVMDDTAAVTVDITAK
ncbi:hypothetical protein CFN78_02935 [Amycolatopsis antarctica]|uniref:OmpA-like domain-containing protein n=1 Tax=Amycolatopsis antarctica TaxID=1854586 RepID=A0A263DCB5_9PSEU|nr:OmpA family protein [Amycolatopsis antarctica]OZM75136.1 hypothetical protein CFN78_02935 [Amycolatopsis antarctica]